MQNAMIVTLKVLSIVCIALLLACQIFLLPPAVAGMAARFPEYSDLAAPGLTLSILFLACVQVVLVCLWQLLSLVDRATIFSSRAFIWVDIIIGATLTAAILLAAGLVFISAQSAGSPSILLLFLVMITVATGLALVMIVMRRLLRNARTMQEELAEVV